MINSNTNIIFRQKSYLSTVIKGRFKDTDENRLTKIYCATFNHSVVFRNLFLKFIGYHGNNNLIASDQFYRKTKRRNFIDICIGEKNMIGDITTNKIKIVIENKTNTNLSDIQFENYDEIQEIINIKNLKHKYAFIKKYEIYSTTWRTKHWSEFYNFIITNNKYNNLINGNTKTVDKFLIDNFLCYLKENHMDTVKSINFNDLGLIYNIFDFKRARSIKKQKQPFEIASDFIDMLKGLIERTKENKLICGKIEKNFQFNPWVGSWYYLDDEKKEKFPCIVAKIRLKKPVNDIIRLETGLYFEKKGQKVYAYVWSSIVKKDAFYPNEKAFRKKLLDYNYYCNETIKFWNRKLKGRKDSKDPMKIRSMK